MFFLEHQIHGSGQLSIKEVEAHVGVVAQLICTCQILRDSKLEVRERRRAL